MGCGEAFSHLLKTNFSRTWEPQPEWYGGERLGREQGVLREGEQRNGVVARGVCIKGQFESMSYSKNMLVDENDLAQKKMLMQRVVG